MKKNNFANNNIEELKKLLIETQKSMFDLRVDNNLRKLKNFKSINQKRKEIARIKTQIIIRGMQENRGIN